MTTTDPQTHTSRLFTLIGAVAIVGLISGCASLAPQALTADALQQGASADRLKAQVNVAPIQGPLTLDEAIARALKFNLERRVKLIEESIALGQYDAGLYDMLPKLLAQAGAKTRSTNLVSRSTDSVTGAPSLANPFISSDRTSGFTDLGLTWSLLDFGTGYLNAKHNGDRILIAAERRRKAMHTLMQDVRTAFWRAASAQRLDEDVRSAIALAEEALSDSAKAGVERERSPLDNLRYQRQVTENLRLLESAQQELSTAKTELALLINAPLATKLQLTEPANGLTSKVLDLPVANLEEVAVAKNADLREQFYNVRIATEETRKVMTRLFPNLSFNYNIKYDNNSYLINQNWNEAGLTMSFNLFNLLSAPTQMALSKAGVALADQRRIATQMSMLAQVHIARIQYANALLQLKRAESIASIDARIGVITSSRADAQVQSKLDAVANRATSILSLMRRYQALAQAHSAASKLQATLGLEPEFDSLANLDLAQLTKVVRDAGQEWDSGRMPALPQPTPVKGAAVPAPIRTAAAN